MKSKYSRIEKFFNTVCPRVYTDTYARKQTFVFNIQFATYLRLKRSIIYSFHQILSRRMSWVWHVARMGSSGMHTKLKSENMKRLLRKDRCNWKCNIIIDIKIQDVGVWIHLAQDKGQWRILGNLLINVWVSLEAGDSFSS